MLQNQIKDVFNVTKCTFPVPGDELSTPYEYKPLLHHFLSPYQENSVHFVRSRPHFENATRFIFIAYNDEGTIFSAQISNFLAHPSSGVDLVNRKAFVNHTTVILSSIPYTAKAPNLAFFVSPRKTLRNLCRPYIFLSHSSFTITLFLSSRCFKVVQHIPITQFLSKMLVLSLCLQFMRTFFCTFSESAESSVFQNVLPQRLHYKFSYSSPQEQPHTIFITNSFNLIFQPFSEAKIPQPSGLHRLSSSSDQTFESP